MLLTGLTGDFDSEVLRLRYSSMTTPPSVYDQHMATGAAHERADSLHCSSNSSSSSDFENDLKICHATRHHPACTTSTWQQVRQLHQWACTR
jgi:hypothetical protein